MDRPSRSKALWILVFIPPLVAIVATVLAPQPHGHWTEHLNGVTLKASQLVLLLVLATMLGWRTLRPLLLVAFVAVGVGIVFRAIGDGQVANSIWRTAWDPASGPATSPDRQRRSRRQFRGL